MTARTFILTVGATFVLAAPAAQANLERILPAKASVAAHHKIVAKHHKVTAKQHKVSKSTGPLYIYFPGTPNQASSPYVDDCLSSGNNCTDDQNCSIWGMNCDLVGSATTNDAPSAASIPVESSPSTDQSTSAPVNSGPASNYGPPSDFNGLLCPTGGVWDEDHHYCV